MSEKLSTQLDYARAGMVTPQMEAVARAEGRSAEFIRDGVAAGRIVIPANHGHKSLQAMGIGRELKAKLKAEGKI